MCTDRLKQIIKGEYVNTANHLVKDPTKQKPTMLTKNTQGQIIAQPKTQYRITTIEHWTDAFLIFSVCILKHTHKKLNKLSNIYMT